MGILIVYGRTAAGRENVNNRCQNDEINSLFIFSSSYSLFLWGVIALWGVAILRGVVTLRLVSTLWFVSLVRSSVVSWLAVVTLRMIALITVVAALVV